MSFVKKYSLNFPSSVSYLNNNLTTMRDESRKLVSFAAAHKSSVHMVSKINDQEIAKEAISRKQQEAFSYSPVLQTKFVCISGHDLLVVAFAKGLQVYSSDATLLKFFHRIGTADGFIRGICGYKNLLVVGTALGKLLIFSVSSGDAHISLDQTVVAQTCAVTSLISDPDFVYVGYDNGSVSLLQGNPLLRATNKTIPTGYPVLSLAAWNGCFVGGYLNGKILVYDTKRCSLCAEVNAHVRSVSAMDIAENGLLLSVSEDTYIRVWQLISNGKTFKIALLWQEIMPDKVLVGAQFTSSTGDGFAVSSYDAGEITVFVKA